MCIVLEITDIFFFIRVLKFTLIRSVQTTQKLIQRKITMISIHIEGKELYIKEGISITMELNNSIFNTEKIEGDIIFTFDVQAEQNGHHLFVVF